MEDPATYSDAIVLSHVFDILNVHYYQLKVNWIECFKVNTNIIGLKMNDFALLE